ncbi:MAG: hypothetical protein PHP46_02985 [Candidatus Omnitrophica bacterium]|nr:hypothetical protein [Candidatus Omnitrophota bacterium]
MGEIKVNVEKQIKVADEAMGSNSTMKSLINEARTALAGENIQGLEYAMDKINTLTTARYIATNQGLADGELRYILDRAGVKYYSDPGELTKALYEKMMSSDIAYTYVNKIANETRSMEYTLAEEFKYMDFGLTKMWVGIYGGIDQMAKASDFSLVATSVVTSAAIVATVITGGSLLGAIGVSSTMFTTAAFAVGVGGFSVGTTAAILALNGQTISGYQLLGSYVNSTGQAFLFGLAMQAPGTVMRSLATARYALSRGYGIKEALYLAGKAKDTWAISGVFTGINLSKGMAAALNIGKTAFTSAFFGAGRYLISDIYFRGDKFEMRMLLVNFIVEGLLGALGGILGKVTSISLGFTGKMLAFGALSVGTGVIVNGTGRNAILDFAVGLGMYGAVTFANWGRQLSNVTREIGGKTIQLTNMQRISYALFVGPQSKGLLTALRYAAVTSGFMALGAGTKYGLDRIRFSLEGLKDEYGKTVKAWTNEMTRTSLFTGAILGLAAAMVFAPKGLAQLSNSGKNMMKYGAGRVSLQENGFITRQIVKLFKLGETVTGGQLLAIHMAEGAISWVGVSPAFNIMTGVWKWALGVVKKGWAGWAEKITIRNDVTGEEVSLRGSGLKFWKTLATSAIAGPMQGIYMGPLIKILTFETTPGIEGFWGSLKVAMANAPDPIFKLLNGMQVAWNGFLGMFGKGVGTGSALHARLLSQRFYGILGKYAGGLLGWFGGHITMAGYVTGINMVLSKFAKEGADGEYRVTGFASWLADKEGGGVLGWFFLFAKAGAKYTKEEMKQIGFFQTAARLGASKADIKEFIRAQKASGSGGMTGENVARIVEFVQSGKAEAKNTINIDLGGGRTHKVEGLTEGFIVMCEMALAEKGYEKRGQGFLRQVATVYNDAKAKKGKAVVKMFGRDITLTDNMMNWHAGKVLEIAIGPKTDLKDAATRLSEAVYEQREGITLGEVMGDKLSGEAKGLANLKITSHLSDAILRASNMKMTLIYTKTEAERNADMEKAEDFRNKASECRTQAQTEAALGNEAASTRLLRDAAKFEIQAGILDKGATLAATYIVGDKLVSRAKQENRLTAKSMREIRKEARAFQGLLVNNTFLSLLENTDTLPKNDKVDPKLKAPKQTTVDNRGIIERIKSGLKTRWEAFKFMQNSRKSGGSFEKAMKQLGIEIRPEEVNNYKELYNRLARELTGFDMAGKDVSGKTLKETGRTAMQAFQDVVDNLTTQLASAKDKAAGLDLELRINIIKNFMECNGRKDLSGETFNLKLKPQQIVYTYLLCRSQLNGLLGEGTPLAVMTIFVGGGKLMANIIASYVAIKTFVSMTKDYAEKKARILIIADAGKEDLVRQMIDNVSSSVAEADKDMGIYRVTKPSESDLGIRDRQGNKIEGRAIKDQAIIFATERTVKEHMGYTKEGKSSILDFIQSVHVDEIQTTMAANDLIKSTDKNLYRELLKARPDLAEAVRWRSEVFVKSYEILRKMLPDVSGEELIAGKYFKAIDEMGRGAFTLREAEMLKFWIATKNMPEFAAYHKEGSKLPTKEFRKLVERLVSSWVMGDRTYKIDPYNRMYHVRDAQSGEVMENTIFGDNILAACVAAKHGFGVEKVADVLIQRSNFNVSTAEWMNKVRMNRITGGTATPEGCKKNLTVTGNEIVAEITESRPLDFNTARFLLARGERGVKDMVFRIIDSRLMSKKIDVIAQAVTSRSESELRSAFAEATSRYAGKDVDIYLLLRGRGNTCYLPEYARTHDIVKAKYGENGAKYVDFETAVDVAKALFNEGRTSLIFIQGLSAGSNIFGVKGEQFDVQGNPTKKADVIFLGLTNYDNLRQAAGRINDPSKERAHGGLFIQVVNTLDAELKGSERSFLESKCATGAAGTDLARMPANENMQKLGRVLENIQKTMGREIDVQRTHTFLSKSNISQKNVAELMDVANKKTASADKTLSLEKTFSMPVTLGAMKATMGLTTPQADAVMQTMRGTRGDDNIFVGDVNVIDPIHGTISDGQILTSAGAAEFMALVQLGKTLGVAESRDSLIAGLSAIDVVDAKTRQDVQDIQSTLRTQFQDPNASLDMNTNLISAGKVYELLYGSAFNNGAVPIDELVGRIEQIGTVYTVARDNGVALPSISEAKFTEVITSTNPTKMLVDSYKAEVVPQGNILSRAYTTLLNKISWTFAANPFMKNLDKVISASAKAEKAKSEYQTAESAYGKDSWRTNVYKSRYKSAEDSLESIRASMTAISGISKVPISIAALRLFVSADMTQDNVGEMVNIAAVMKERNPSVSNRVSMADLYKIVSAQDRTPEKDLAAIITLEKSKTDAPLLAASTAGFNERAGTLAYNFITGRTPAGKMGAAAMNIGVAASLILAPVIGITLAVSKELLTALVETAESRNIGGLRKASSTLVTQVPKAFLKAAAQSAVFGLGAFGVEIPKKILALAAAIYAGVNIWTARMMATKGYVVSPEGRMRWLNNLFTPVEQTFESPYVAQASKAIKDLGENITYEAVKARTGGENPTAGDVKLREQIFMQLNPAIAPRQTEAMINQMSNSDRARAITARIDNITEQINIIDAKLARIPTIEATGRIREEVPAVVETARPIEAKARSPDEIRSYRENLAAQRSNLSTQLNALNTFNNLPSLIKVGMAKSRLEDISKGNIPELRYDVYKANTGTLDADENNILLYLATGEDKVFNRSDTSVFMTQGRNAIGALGNLATVGQVLRATTGRFYGDREKDGKGIVRSSADVKDKTTFAALAIEIADYKVKNNISITDQERETNRIARVIFERRSEQVGDVVREKSINKEGTLEDGTANPGGVRPDDLATFMDFMGRDKVNHDELQIFFDLIFAKKDMSVPDVMNDYLKKTKDKGQEEDYTLGVRVTDRLISETASNAEETFTDHATRDSDDMRKYYNRLISYIETSTDSNVADYILNKIVPRTLFINGEYLAVGGSNKGFVTALMESGYIDNSTLIQWLKTTIAARDTFEGTNATLLDELESLSAAAERMAKPLNERYGLSKKEFMTKFASLSKEEQASIMSEKALLNGEQLKTVNEVLLSAREREGDNLFNEGELAKADSIYRRALSLIRPYTAQAQDIRARIADKVISIMNNQIGKMKDWTEKTVRTLDKFYFIKSMEEIDKDIPLSVKEPTAELKELRAKAPKGIPLRQQYIDKIDEALGSVKTPKPTLRQRIMDLRSVIASVLSGTGRLGQTPVERMASQVGIFMLSIAAVYAILSLPSESHNITAQFVLVGFLAWKNRSKIAEDILSMFVSKKTPPAIKETEPFEEKPELKAPKLLPPPVGVERAPVPSMIGPFAPTMTSALQAKLVAATSIIDQVGFELSDGARLGISMAVEDEGREGLSVVVNYNGIDYAGANLEEALDNMKENAKDITPETLEKIKEAVISESYGAYEASYIQLSDGTVRLNHTAAFEVRMEGTEPVLYKRTCTKKVAAGDAITQKGHLHLGKIESREQLYGDMVAMMIEEHITGSKDLPEHIWQLTTREDGSKVFTLSKLEHANGLFRLYNYNRQTKEFEPVKGFEISEAELLKALTEGDLAAGLERLDEAAIGQIMALRPKAGTFLDKVQSFAGVTPKGVAEILVGRVTDRKIAESIKNLATDDPNSIYGLCSLLKQAGVLTGKYATVIDAREGSGLKIDMNELKNAVEKAGDVINICVVVDTAGKENIIKTLPENVTGNITFIEAENDASTATVLAAVSKTMGDLDIKTNGNIAIALADSDENRKAIENHLKDNREMSFNFSLVDRAVISQINQHTVYVVLANQAVKKIILTAFGVAAESIGSYLEGLRRILGSIMRYIIITKENINKDLRDFINAAKQVSIAM